jgi:hypothetical protein
MGFGRDYRVLVGKGLRLSAMAAGLCVRGREAVCGRRLRQAPKTMLVEPPAPLLPATLGKLKRVAEGDVGDGLGLVDAADATGDDRGRAEAVCAIGVCGGECSRRERDGLQVFRCERGSCGVRLLPQAGDACREGGRRAVSNGDELLMRSGVNVVRETSSPDRQRRRCLH